MPRTRRNERSSLGTRTTAPHGRSISTAGEVSTVSGTNLGSLDINPFLAGTLEVLNKMARIDAVPGKPRVKTDDAASGDVSGIIGITGDALGSLALSFSEACIRQIVANMLNEQFDGVTQEIIDATGELTNMISGASRTQMEKMGLSVYAAIPTVVHGRQHTISHILKSPAS